MQISQPRISQHLKVLKYAGLVNERKEGQRCICSLNQTLLTDTMNEFADYIGKPLEEIPELAGEYARMPAAAGDSCIKKINAAAI